jgi:hypothetical protein
MVIALLAPVLCASRDAHAYAPGCNGPTGSTSAPLGDCTNPVDVDGVKAVQLELWAEIFGSNPQDAQITYNFSPATTFNGPGDYEGTTVVQQHKFKMHVYASASAFATLEISGNYINAWHVLAKITGPTGVSVPVMSVAFTKWSGTALQAPENGFLIVGHVSEDIATDMTASERGDAAAAGGTPSQQDCADRCADTLTASMAVAMAAYATAVATASVVMVNALLACAVLASAPLGGWFLAAVCAAKALVVFALVMTVAAAALVAALNLLRVNYGNCMAGCGFYQI